MNSRTIIQKKYARRLPLVLGAGLLLIGTVAVFIIAFTPGRRQEEEVRSPLSGFALLSLPRSDISIGSAWQQGYGPTGNGLAEASLLKATSLEQADLRSVREFHDKAAAEMKNLLQISAGGKGIEIEDIHLRKLTLIRVADLSSLQIVPGRSYIWEGVRVDDFSASVSNTATASLLAKLRQIQPVARVEQTATSSSTDNLAVSGFNLFVAYRIVNTSSKGSEVIGSTQIGQNAPSSEFDLGNYGIRLSNVYEGQNLFGKCEFRLTIIDLEKLNIKRNYEKQEFTFPCNTAPEPSYALQTTQVGTQVISDRLKISNFHGWTLEGNTAQMTGTFILERRTFSLSSVEYPSAPGW